MAAMFDELANQIVPFAPHFATSVLIFLEFWLPSVAVQTIIGRFGGQSDLTPDVLNLLQQTAKTALLIFGGITALSYRGRDAGHPAPLPR
jgi:hypothetical protein